MQVRRRREDGLVVQLGWRELERSSGGGDSGTGGGDAEVPKPTRTTRTIGCTGGAPCECKANEDCTQSCTVAGCSISFKDDSRCSADCRTSGAGCAQTCEADCTITNNCTCTGVKC